MVTRVHLEDEDAAQALAEELDRRGHEVAIVKERFAGEDDDEALEFVVCTTAPEGALVDLVDEDAFVEVD